MAVLSLLLFGDCLIVPHRVPALAVSDLRIQYLHWRKFAFDQIRAGHFPLWNPYNFCGTPFFGDPQSAMLFPPNWLNLILAPEAAASWLVALHFFLAGYFAGLWCRSRGSSVVAAIVGGCVYCCCGPIISNLRAGHLPVLCSAAWTPLLFLSVDRILSADARSAWRWTLIGIPVVAMLAVDGYPQFAYYSALAVGLYVLIQLPKAPSRWRAILCTAALFAGGGLIAAAQIIPSAQVAGESVRAGGTGYSMASQFSLPPENLLTLIVPGIFGNDVDLPYYGRWLWWETCVFVGPAALILAICGALRRRREALMVGILLVLALGSYTPVFSLLYHFLPGFANFRAANRFSLLAILFLAMLAATGWDQISLTRPPRWLWLTAAALAAVLGIGAITASASEFKAIANALVASGESTALHGAYRPDVPAQIASLAAKELAIAAIVTAVTAALCAGAARWPLCIEYIALLACGQVILFAARQQARSSRPVPVPARWADAIAATPAGARVLVADDWLADSGIENGFINAAGYNPLTLGRMARFLGAAQAEDPDLVGLHYQVRVDTPVYRMLRCAWVMTDLTWKNWPYYAIPDPLPRFELLGNYTLAGNPDTALADVLDRSFDPRRAIVLESPPNPVPADAAEPAGTLHVVSETTDELEIEADLSRPQVLLITDAYSTGWRADSLDGSAQMSYQILPGDYCLRAIPLAAGHQHFRIIYRPAAVAAGAIVSGAGILIYVVLWGILLQGKAISGDARAT